MNYSEMSDPDHIICWSCQNQVGLLDRAENDGFCPYCNAEIELPDDEGE